MKKINRKWLLTIFIIVWCSRTLCAQSWTMTEVACKTVTKHDNTDLIRLMYPKAEVYPKDEKILGTQIPYGEVMKAGGSKEPTLIMFSEKVTFGNQTVKAGEYYVSVIPNMNNWKVLLTPKSKVALGVNNFDAKEEATVSVSAETKMATESSPSLAMDLTVDAPQSVTLSMTIETSLIEVTIKSTSKVGVKFPWKKIPFPSARLLLDRALYTEPGKSYTLGGVDTILSRAISKVGYADKSYYYKDNDFVMVTPLEQIKETGESEEIPYRWCQDVPPLREFTLSAILKALFTAKVGRYRIIMFMVSDDNLVYETNAPDIDAILELTNGSNVLPLEIRQKKFTPKHYVNILVYEFKKTTADGEAEFVKPSLLTAETHLLRSRISEYFK